MVILTSTYLLFQFCRPMRPKFSLYLWITSCLLLLTMGCSNQWQRYNRPSQSILSQVRVNLEPIDEKVELGDPILLRFSLTNQGGQPVRICRWHSPLEGRFTTNYLQIFRKRRPIHYTGKKPKSQAMLKDYVTLYPGETLSTTVDIRRAYAFHHTGKYDIRFQGNQVNRLKDSQPITIKVK